MFVCARLGYLFGESGLMACSATQQKLWSGSLSALDAGNLPYTKINAMLSHHERASRHLTGCNQTHWSLVGLF